MSYYSVIGKDGMIRLSCVTLDPAYPVAESERLLPDNPPQVYRFDEEYPVRMEPVDEDATEVVYNIIEIQKPPLTVELVIRHTQNILDSFAKTRGYSSMMSACTYANSSIPKFATEGTYCLQIRDLVWAKCYDILHRVETGAMLPQTIEEVVQEFPEMVWP